ncbi:MAG: DUF3990 domain-containing protein [Cardiobacteriaceae bacterium]|nr:DUF3990 domain-containing protein [Cardiobacteriaceae bacterium]
MFLYHGSNVAVKNPQLLKIYRALDFGSGFYTTSDINQAQKWAERTALRLQQKQSFVTVYEVDEQKMNELRFLQFDTPNLEWLHFVVQNRTGQSREDKWDIVKGPVADDQTIVVIDLYIDGMFSEEDAINRLLPQKLKDQYTFKTNRAIDLLYCVEVLLYE